MEIIFCHTISMVKIDKFLGMSKSIIEALCNILQSMVVATIWITKVWWLCHTRWSTNLSNTLQWTHMPCNQVSSRLNPKRRCQQLVCHHPGRKNKVITTSYLLIQAIIITEISHQQPNNTLPCRTTPKARCKFKISNRRLNWVVVMLLLNSNSYGTEEPCHLSLILIRRGSTLTRLKRKLSILVLNSHIDRRNTIFSEASNKVHRRICQKKLVFRPPILSSLTVRSSAVCATVNLGVLELTIYLPMAWLCSTAITVRQVTYIQGCPRDSPREWRQNESIGEKRQIRCFCPHLKLQVVETSRNLATMVCEINNSQTMIDAIDIERKVKT